MTHVLDNPKTSDPDRNGSGSSPRCCCCCNEESSNPATKTGGRLIVDRVIPHPPYGRVLVQWLLTNDNPKCRVEVTGVNQIGRVVAFEQMSVNVGSPDDESQELDDTAYASACRLEDSLCEQMQVTLETVWQDS